jgi:hypothetical protein
MTKGLVRQIVLNNCRRFLETTVGILFEYKTIIVDDVYAYNGVSTIFRYSLYILSIYYYIEKTYN